MKNLLFVLALSVSLFACKKDNLKKDYGCIYGVSKSTGERTYIRCGDHDIYIAGWNQAAADNIASDKNIPKENVAPMQAFTNWEFIPNNKCDCN